MTAARVYRAPSSEIGSTRDVIYMTRSTLAPLYPPNGWGFSWGHAGVRHPIIDTWRGPIFTVRPIHLAQSAEYFARPIHLMSDSVLGDSASRPRRTRRQRDKTAAGHGGGTRRRRRASRRPTLHAARGALDAAEPGGAECGGGRGPAGARARAARGGQRFLPGRRARCGLYLGFSVWPYGCRMP